MLNLGIPIEFGPVAGGGGGSKWYAPLKGKPPVAPNASGLNALAGGNKSEASGAYSVAFGEWARAFGGTDVAIGYLAWVNQGVCVGYDLVGTAGDVNIGRSQTNYFSGGFNVNIGYQNTLLGIGADSAVSIGNTNHSGKYGITMGIACWSSGLGSFSAGYAAFSIGVNQVSLGRGAQPVAYGNILDGQSQANSTNRSGVNYNNTTVVALASSVIIAKSVVESYANPVLVNGNLPFWIADNQATSVEGHMVIRRASDGVCAKWKISGLARRAGDTVTLVGFNIGVAGAPDINDAAAAGWIVTTAVNTASTPDYIEFYVNFNSATNTEAFAVAIDLSIIYPTI